MSSGESRLIRIGVVFLVLFLFTSARAYAQEIVSTESIDDWFVDRLVIGALFGSISGALVGIFHLSRLKYQLQTLHVNSQARKKFGFWLIFILIVSAVLLLLDAWKLFPFRLVSLSFLEAFGQVWLSYKMVVIVSIVGFTFYLSAALATRLVPGSRSQYALLPWPRPK